VGVRLIALDLDGTLLDNEGRVPPGNIEALGRAVEAGIEIVVATGRRFDFARPIFEQLPRPLTLIVSNGAAVKTCGGETLERRLLPRETARTVLAAVPAHRSAAALLFDRPHDAQVVFERVDWDHPRHGRYFRANRRYIVEIAPLERALTEDPLQLMFTGGCVEMRDLFDTLRAGVPPSAPAVSDAPGRGARDGTGAPPYAVTLTEYLHRDFSLVDIIGEGCSKGAALAAHAARRGVPAADVMAIGDNLNDLQMLEFAGHPVIMGNAVEELKARGWPTAPANDEAGVAAAIDAVLAGTGVGRRGTL
jgi:hydroxymethylpyrimidine pyrophosphatase-like HAD family hydrolase